MAVIENERDKILQAADPRVIPIPIPIENVDGLGDKLDDIDDAIDEVQQNVDHVMTNTQDLGIRASSLSLTNSNSTTLTAIRKNGLTGSVSWSLFAGSASLNASGDTCTIYGSSVSSLSITVKASIGTKEAYVTINKLGVLSNQDYVNLTSQVTGALAMGNVTGYGALALLNTVNLNTQTTGALNASTQVTNLGALAFANAIAANQIGAGTLAAGVIYAGTINANNITSGTLQSGVIYAGTLSANQITTGTLSADRISGGVIRSSNVNTSEVYASGVMAMFLGNHAYFSCNPASGATIHSKISSPGLVISNDNGPPLQITQSTNISTSHPNGTICFHPTYGLMFVKDGVRYICSTTPLT